MNVRFFGGRKEEYVSIPKHNPIGLYFCADTRELFLGDRLLSDGLRVVPTFADLPSIDEHKAAEGIIYFIAETKNGYVLPRGGTEWLQVIYAPANGIGGDVDLSNYYTKAEVDEAILKAIANIELEVDLTDYATKEEVAAIEATIPSIEGLATKQELLDNYVTNETLQNNYITQQEIANTYITEQHIIQNYITKETAAETYVTAEKVTEIVETQVNDVVTAEIEAKVETAIQEKVDAGDIYVKVESISYDTW